MKCPMLKSKHRPRFYASKDIKAIQISWEWVKIFDRNWENRAKLAAILKRDSNNKNFDIYVDLFIYQVQYFGSEFH